MIENSQSSPAPKARGPSPEKTAKTREAIVRAAMQEFLAHGYAAATMAAVAGRAGLAKGTIYLYFPTKEALFAGVVRDVITNPLDEAERVPIQDGERVGDYLRRTLLPVMQRIELTGRASVARIVVTEGASFPVLVDVYREGVYEPLLEHIRSHAALAFSRGELGSDELVRHPHLLVGPLWIGIIHNGLLDSRNPVDIGALFEAHLNMIFC